MPRYSHKQRGCGALVAILCLGAGAAAADVRVTRVAGVPTEYSDRLAPSDGVALALPSDRAAVTSAGMQGRWMAHAEDGTTTLLELRAGGAFRFDRQARATPERAYMCGDWSLEHGELSLLAKTSKTRLVSGEIELSDAGHTQTYTVLAARSDVLVLRTESATLTFHRRG
jgi:hypothetical protein